MDGFLLGFAVSAAVVFVAELGDKSQLMALAFATRFRALPVIVGITLATALVHLASVAVGHAMGAALPTGWIALAAAVAFVGFGMWTLRGDALSDAERAKASRAGGSAVAVSAVAFFLAELGDKTMLATITLATQYEPVGVWLGSTLGMVAADALAIAVGRALGRRLPERVVRIGAAGLFLAGGLWLANDAAVQLTGEPLHFDHHAAGWIALGLAVAAVLVVVVGRYSVPAGPGGPGGGARRVAGGLFLAAGALGLAAPLLVGTDVIDPIALFENPGVVVIGVGLSLLGTALVLAAQVQGVAARGLATQGLYARIRNPGLTGMVVAMGGTLLMVPTLVAVLAAVVLVVAVQVQARAVREPRLARQHGDGYAEYAARTGRFLPRLRPHDHPGLPGSEQQRVG